MARSMHRILVVLARTAGRFGALACDGEDA